MGSDLALDCALALHDSNSRPVPLEFSMAPIFPSRPRNLCGGGAADSIAIIDRSCHCACLGCSHRHRSFNLPHSWRLRFSAHMDLCRTHCSLVLFRTSVTQFRISAVGASCDDILYFARDVSLHPDKLRSSEIQFFSRTA